MQAEGLGREVAGPQGECGRGGSAAHVGMVLGEHRRRPGSLGWSRDTFSGQEREHAGPTLRPVAVAYDTARRCWRGVGSRARGLRRTDAGRFGLRRWRRFAGKAVSWSGDGMLGQDRRLHWKENQRHLDLLVELPRYRIKSVGVVAQHNGNLQDCRNRS